MGSHSCPSPGPSAHPHQAQYSLPDLVTGLGLPSMSAASSHPLPHLSPIPWTQELEDGQTDRSQQWVLCPLPGTPEQPWPEGQCSPPQKGDTTLLSGAQSEGKESPQRGKPWPSKVREVGGIGQLLLGQTLNQMLPRRYEL